MARIVAKLIDRATQSIMVTSRCPASQYERPQLPLAATRLHINEVRVVSRSVYLSVNTCVRPSKADLFERQVLEE